MSYASLHCHTHYSNIRILDSINREDELIDNAFNKGLKGVAITDHDVLSGHVQAVKHFQKKYVKEQKDFKLILGNEIYITREGLNKEDYEKGEKFYHFLLLAKNAKGHEQIREISSRAWSRGFMNGVMRTPTYPSDLKEIIGANQGNIIATSACLAGLPAVLYNVYGADATDQIRDQLVKFEQIFGKGNFYIELQPSTNPEQIAYNDFMVKTFWNEFPFVFTTDAHYLNKEDALVHKQFLNSKDGSNREVDKYYSHAYIMTFEEVQQLLISYIDEAKIERMRLNTLAILDQIEIYDLFHEQIVPTTPIDFTINDLDKRVISLLKTKEYKYINAFLQDTDKYDSDFIVKVFNGLFDKVEITEENQEMYLDRLEYELEQVYETSVHIKQPLSKYFTTMARMIDIIWTKGDSLVGVSRGSGAGFLVNYCLGITQLDPLTQALELPAWRFIHKDRPGLPDIDIDTEGSKRNKVFRAVQQYFQEIGGDLINVCTFGTQKSKAALRTAARGLDLDDDIISFIVSLVPNERGMDWTLNQCMFGDEEHEAIKKFKEEVDKVEGLWNLASKIEGLITQLGVHASGVIAFNENFTKHNSVMKTTRGVIVSAFNLEDTEYMGGLKYDFLTINALDKIRTTMNLLLEDGILDWVDDLRGTYNKYLLPKNLDYTSPEMWEMVHNGKIVDIFQFDTQVGAQAVKRIKPVEIAQLSVANSIMRLMAQGEDAELPLETYAKFKNNQDLWYEEMRNFGLNDEEVTVLEKHLKKLSGVADSQESAMLLVMDEKISNFTVTEANNLRKAIAKKKADVMEATKNMFYEKGLALGTRKQLLDYVWEVQIYRQAGYSFSVLHTMGYSTIALQEMNLAYRWPIIYWNTACLSVNAGAVNEEDYEALLEDGIIEIDEDEDNKREASKVQYGKVAAAISKFRDELGLVIQLPDINKAKFGFTPDADKNEVLYGLKGISRVGDGIIREIIARRPYKSLQNFLEKMNSESTVISKDKVIMLIKAGAFDKIENKDREQILKDYVRSVADQKKRITLQNLNMLIEKELIPDDYDYQKRVYKFTKYIRKSKVDGLYYGLDDVAYSFYYENYGHPLRVNTSQGSIDAIKIKDWDKIYDMEMDYIRKYMAKENASLLNNLNDMLFQEEYVKYAEGNQLSWELESLNFYHSGHELANIGETFPIEISSLKDINDSEIEGYFTIRKKNDLGKLETIVIPKYKIHHIIGTVLDKDKTKHTVILSTPDGVVSIKLFRAQFAKFDQVLSTVNYDGTKNILQDSFFKKGTFLLVTGMLRGDVFVPKVYKDMEVEPILMFHAEDGKFKKGYKKLGD